MDELNIMAKGMLTRWVEVLTNSSCDEDGAVIVELVKVGLHLREHVFSEKFAARKVTNIEKCTECANDV